MSGPVTSTPSVRGWATGCTNRQTRDTPGVGSASRAHSRSRPSWFTRATQTSSWSARWGTSSRPRATRVASSALPTAERPGSRHCTSTTRPASERSPARRVYVIGDFGLYRSDDGGTAWRHMAADDKRIANAQGGYNSGVFVDPKNPDIVYTFHVTAYKSTDGGNSFTAFKGGPPGGDDPQVMWIDPTDGKRVLMGYDQGAIVSFDGGDTWSSWYNQSTEQVYHIAADNAFPYWIYATQQDAGAIATRSRGNLGAITPLDWKPVPGWEWGTVLPDPRDPNIVYSSGIGISKIIYPGEEWIKVGPDQDPSLKLRGGNNAPIAFATWNGRRELLAGYQYLMATADGGATWTKLSPDLTETRAAPHDTSVSSFAAITSIAASTVTPGVIWIATNTGIIQVSRNHGKSWSDVTIPGIEIGRRPIFPSVEASPFDAGTAYAALDAHYRGDDAPSIYRKRDYGKTWTKIVAGLPATL